MFGSFFPVVGVLIILLQIITIMENGQSQMQKLYKIVEREAKRRGYEMQNILHPSSICAICAQKKKLLVFVQPCQFILGFDS